MKAKDAAATDALLAQAKPIADKVKVLRDKAFAHRSVHISYNDVFRLAAVTPKELRDLTDMTLKVANCLLLACRCQGQHFTPLPRDAERMMKALAHMANQS